MESQFYKIGCKMKAKYNVMVFENKMSRRTFGYGEREGFKRTDKVSYCGASRSVLFTR
jgi:hypothetical protein